MKKMLTLAGIVLVLATAMILADDDTPAPQATSEAPGMMMPMAGCMPGQMMAMGGDRWPGRGMGRGMMAGRGDDDDMGPGMGMCCNLLDCKDLNLTKEQVKKIQDINFAHRNAMIDQKAALEKAQLKMGEEMKSDSPDKARALAAVKEINGVKAQMAEARITHMFALRGVLTAEQLEKVNACRGGGMGAGMCGGKCGGAMGAAKGAGTPCGKPCGGPAACGKGK